MKMKTMFGATIATVVVALSLTGCGNTPAPVETTAPPVVKETPTPTPTDTTTVIPEDEIIQDDVTERNADGAFVLPDGTTMTCDDSATAVALVDGEWVCDIQADW